MPSPSSSNSQYVRWWIWVQDVACKTASPPPPQHGQQDAGALRADQATLPGAPPSWRQDLGLQNGVSTPPTRPAGCWRSKGGSGDTPGSAAILAAGPWLAKRRLHPPPTRPAGCWRSQGGSGDTPGSAAILAAGPWLAKRRLHPPQHGQQDAGAPRADLAAGPALFNVLRR